MAKNKKKKVKVRKIEITHHPLSWYVNMIQNGSTFSFSRWSDGEWNAVLGDKGANCDRHEYFPEMGKDLRDILRSGPKYIMALSPVAVNFMGNRISSWLDQGGMSFDWHSSDMFHNASIQGELRPLIEAFQKRSVVIVGPGHLRGISKFVKYAEFVEVPRLNCYLHIDRLCDDVIKICRGLERPVVSVSASMPAEILIDRVFHEMGSEVSLIDFGSLWDPFVGVRSRGYHHKGIRMDQVVSDGS